MSDFVAALTGDLDATNDGWECLPAVRSWRHPCGLLVTHLHGRTVYAEWAGGERTITGARGKESDGALDVAKQLIGIVWTLTGRPT